MSIGEILRPAASCGAHLRAKTPLRHDHRRQRLHTLPAIYRDRLHALHILKHPQPPTHREVPVWVGRNCRFVFGRVSTLTEAVTVYQAIGIRFTHHLQTLDQPGGRHDRAFRHRVRASRNRPTDCRDFEGVIRVRYLFSAVKSFWTDSNCQLTRQRQPYRIPSASRCNNPRHSAKSGTSASE